MASPPAAANTASNAHFTWSIENLSKLSTEILYSEVFYAGRCKWKIGLNPAGDDSNHLSVYLDVADSETLPSGWNRETQVCLAVINPTDYELSVRKVADHWFDKEANNLGYPKFICLADLKDPEKGYFLNDTLFVEADVTVRSVIEYSLEEEVPSVEEVNNCKKGQGGHLIEEAAHAIPPDDVCTVHQASHKVSRDQASVADMAEKAILVDATSAVTSAPKAVDSAPAAGNTVKFLSYRVSSEASLVLEKIHNLHENTFTKFSMEAPAIQTAILEFFAFFIKSTSITKVSEMNDESLCLAAGSVKDFEQLGLDLSWLNQRLDEAKRVNKHL